MEKLNIDFIRSEFKKEGYQLLTTEYKNNKQKLDYICPKGHCGNISWCDWSQGKRCLECSGKKKKTIEFIRQEFEKEGYKLLTTDYINNEQKLEYICPKGHKGTITWDSWSQGKRCLECAGCKKKTIEFIRKEFEKEGYRLLTKEYKNSRQKLEYICPKSHKNTIMWHNWNLGKRCSTCAGVKQKTIEFIKEEFEKEGYKLLTIKYKNAHQKLEYICPKGHKGNIKYNSWQQRQRCLECSGYKKKDIDFIRQEFEKEGYQLLTTEYKNNEQKLDYICPKGHFGTVRWNGWNQGIRCGACSHIGSKAETEIHDFVKSYFSDTLHNDRKIIAPKELDIVIPSKKIAIEYCGLYWHSEAVGKDKYYHLNKLNMAKEQDYRLITIFEDEYINNKNAVLNKLKDILEVSDIIEVDMSKCVIKEIGSKTAKAFYKKHHIHKYTDSDISLGMYLDGTLLSVITFLKNRLNQFCALPNYDIQGIMSKFLTYFTDSYHYNSVYTYADKRWYDDVLYKTLGLKRLETTEPTYQYVKKDGYNKIWDCGNIKFVMNTEGSV